MLISRNWLQSHFETVLPDANRIAETLMLHSFEIEDIHKIKDDQIIDIDVLPNRAHDCLSYAGIAKEYAVLTGYELKSNRYHYHDSVMHSEDSIDVVIHNTDQCYRYMARIINNIKVGNSPTWLKNRMESIGQRSINNIVDTTNYLMFDLGNPIHAFDADKIVGKITIRNAHNGEKITILGGNDLDLSSDDLVIADDEGILALAGIKGGSKAEVTKNTKNILLEVANFNPTTTRTTARRLKLFTDSSKRFENHITSELAPMAMESVTRLISDISQTESIGPITDIYSQTEIQKTITVSQDHINRVLGLKLSLDELQRIISQIDYQYKEDDGDIMVTIPFNRLDLLIAEDLIEEIGRIYGYHNIPTKDLDTYLFQPEVHPTVYIENTVKNILIEKGFTEVKNYSFRKKGNIYVRNPIASDKSALRKNLNSGMLESLEKNHNIIDFFGYQRTMIFEIGRVYNSNSEVDMCCIAIENKDKSVRKKYGTEKDQLEELITIMNNHFSVILNPVYEKNSVSFNLDECIGEFDSYRDILKPSSYETNASFHPISVFPYSTRDISLWAPEHMSEKDIRDAILSTGAKYLKKIFLFDQFEKDGKVSYGFSLIFQSNEKTLTDEELALDMMTIEKILIQNNCEIR